MSDESLLQIKGEVVKLRSDILYLVRLVEKLETKLDKVEQRLVQPPIDPMLGKIIEKL